LTSIKRAKNGGKKGEKGGGAVRKILTFGTGVAAVLWGITQPLHISHVVISIPYLCIIMIKKFNIIASHMSDGAMQENPSYEMGITKYARMRQDRIKDQKIAMMTEAYKRAEASEMENEIGMIMPFVKR
jgi:hypothetical protein